MEDRPHKRGTKRKRTNDDEDRTVRLTGKLHHVAREVRQAAKKAKTFDTQKLVKKLKGIRDDTQNNMIVKDLETQLEVLKHVDPELIGNAALITKINKDKVLASNPAMKDAVAQQLTGHVASATAAGTPAAKVHSRLLSARLLALEVTKAVEALRLIIQPSASQGSSNIPPRGGQEDPPIVSGRLTEMKAKASDSHQGTSQSGEEASDLDAGWESGSIDSNGEVKQDANRNSGEDDSDSGSVSRPDSDDAEGNSMAAIAQSSSEPESDAQPSNSIRKSSTFTRRTGREGQTESAFLPSLAVGYTRGDSDSEASDFEDAPKKNRRGQRARRAIWEKKFGRNANHVKKQREDADAGTSSRGRPRGPTFRQTNPGLDRPKREQRTSAAPPGRAYGRSSSRPSSSLGHFPGQDRRESDSGWGRSIGPTLTSRTGATGSSIQRASAGSVGHAPNAGKTAQSNAVPLHPSWAAKKKQLLGIMPAQGTKITF